MRTRPTYTPEFRADAVALLRRSDRTLSQVADDLGVSKYALRDWYKREEMAKKSKKRQEVPGSKATQEPQDETLKERASRLEREVAALRKENDSLRMDREILKKAAAFFAKEN
jgi:transposase-like protein